MHILQTANRATTKKQEEEEETENSSDVRCIKEDILNLSCHAKSGFSFQREKSFQHKQNSSEQDIGKKTHRRLQHILTAVHKHKSMLIFSHDIKYILK